MAVMRPRELVLTIASWYQHSPEILSGNRSSEMWNSFYKALEITCNIEINMKYKAITHLAT